MKEYMKIVGNLIRLCFMYGTYYGAWQHNWIIILICFIPEFIRIGYGIAEVINK